MYHPKMVITENGDSLFYYLGTNSIDSLNRKLLVLVQGSSRGSVRSMFGYGAEASLFGYDLLLMEKFAFNDSAEFIATDCRQRRMKDISYIVNHVIETHYGGSIEGMILYGASEGGTIAPELALKLPNVTHLIVTGSGGYCQAREFEYLLQHEREVPYEGFLTRSGIKNKGDLAAEFESIKKEPNSMKLWLGHSYMRWSSYLWYEPEEYIAQLQIPALFYGGALDRNAAIESIAYLEKRFADKPGIRAVVVPDADHGLRDSKGKDIHGKFIRETLIPWLRETGAVDAQR
ncbi:MAG: alpha/beta fold hydrolase [Chitinispirillaceae bacterium]